MARLPQFGGVHSLTSTSYFCEQLTPGRIPSAARRFSGIKFIRSLTSVLKIHRAKCVFRQYQPLPFPYSGTLNEHPNLRFPGEGHLTPPTTTLFESRFLLPCSAVLKIEARALQCAELLRRQVTYFRDKYYFAPHSREQSKCMSSGTMFRPRLCLLLVWVCCSLSFGVVNRQPSPEHQSWRLTQHERRQSPPASWTRRSRLSPELTIPLRVALKQSNIHELEMHLLSVSTPGSKEYGKHWTHERIAETFKPSSESVSAVWKWLIDAGVQKDAIRRSQSLGWISANVTVGLAERLLDAEYWLWEHDGSGQGHVACESYGVPE